MSHPHDIPLPAPAPHGQTQTLFVTEGIPTALLVTTRKGRRRSRPRRFGSPALALAWCQAARSMMVYLPADLAGN